VSISTDGDVMLWTLAKCELLPERLMRLQPSANSKAGAAVGAAGGAAASSSAVAAADELLPQQQADGGLCMDFSKVCIPCGPDEAPSSVRCLGFVKWQMPNASQFATGQAVMLVPCAPH